MCAIAGAYSARGENVVPLLASMLQRMYNRGHTMHGVAVYDSKKRILHIRKGKSFSLNSFEDLKGDIGVAHLRYSTRGETEAENKISYSAQPQILKFAKYRRAYIPESLHGEKLDLNICNFMVIEHNGDIFDTGERRDELYVCDIKYLAYPLADKICNFYNGNFERRQALNATDSIRDLKGAYTYLGFVVDNEAEVTMFCGRDPWGIRPGFVTWLDSDDFQGWLAASEDLALRALGCRDTFELEHGCAYAFDRNSFEARIVKRYEKIKRPLVCAFEYVYFADIGTTIDGLSVASAKYLLGYQLGIEHKVEDEEQRIIPVPDSGRSMARGFADANGMPYFEGFSKNRYVSERSFILQTQKKRELVALNKTTPIHEIMEGQSVILVDDSIVRGTTMKAIIRNVREVGEASEVHVRISSPPLLAPCYLGIDMKSTNEFIAAEKAKKLGYDPYNLQKKELEEVIDEICKEIEADSLAYLSLKGMQKVLGKKCYGCWGPKFNPPYLRKDIESYIKNYPEGYRK